MGDGARKLPKLTFTLKRPVVAVGDGRTAGGAGTMVGR